ncbi:MAG: bifunctional hydroxymethylpyrimidine kinase/phosphomethylpyrimidine kinase [Planctomycetota bacterium]|jgi:hydroxymethylpyrimidine/phosphomethylpyrimidine kinase
MPSVLCLGGSDPEMGAGVQMDTAVCRAMGVAPRVVETLFTKQSAQGLESVNVRGIKGIGHDILHSLDEGVQAIKIGALGDAQVVEAVVAALEPWHEAIPIVVDPVAAASKTVGAVALNTLEGVRKMESDLFPLATLVTPNVLEYGTGERYAECRAILRKGGHADAFAEMEGRAPADWVADVLERAQSEPMEFRHDRISGGEALHGTGCALSTAIACGLAKGQDLVDACRNGIEALQGWMASAVAAEGALAPEPPARP